MINVSNPSHDIIVVQKLQDIKSEIPIEVFKQIFTFANIKFNLFSIVLYVKFAEHFLVVVEAFSAMI